MFLSEKIAEMVAMGSSVKEINKFKDTYSAEIIKGTLPAEAMEFAEAKCFGGPGSGRYPAGSGAERKASNLKKGDKVKDDLGNEHEVHHVTGNTIHTLKGKMLHVTHAFKNGHGFDSEV